MIEKIILEKLKEKDMDVIELSNISNRTVNSLRKYMSKLLREEKIIVSDRKWINDSRKPTYIYGLPNNDNINKEEPTINNENEEFIKIKKNYNILITLIIESKLGYTELMNIDEIKQIEDMDYA